MKQANKKRICRRLLKEYKKIKNKHYDIVLQKTASVTLGPSVIRVFKEKTKKDIVKALQRISINDLKKACKSKKEFKKWFVKKSQKINRALRPRKGIHMQAGSKRWAHATKITSLYLRDLLCQYGKKFTKNNYDRAEKMFYTPLDGIVLTKLKKICKGCDYELKIPGSMSSLKTKQQFFHIQDCLHFHAYEAGMPAIWFDDIWATNR